MLQKPITAVLFCITILAACSDPSPVVTSTLISNAVIHSGSGDEAIHGSVRINGDRILEIGEIEPRSEGTKAKLEKLKCLESSIGTTGLLAIKPFMQMNQEDLWQFYMLSN